MKVTRIYTSTPHDRDLVAIHVRRYDLDARTTEYLDPVHGWRPSLDYAVEPAAVEIPGIDLIGMEEARPLPTRRRYEHAVRAMIAEAVLAAAALP